MRSDSYIQNNNSNAVGIFSKNISYWGSFWIIQQKVLNISQDYFEWIDLTFPINSLLLLRLTLTALSGMTVESNSYIKILLYCWAQPHTQNTNELNLLSIRWGWILTFVHNDCLLLQCFAWLDKKVAWPL